MLRPHTCKGGVFLSDSSELLFNFLREIFYNPSKAVLDVEKLDEDFVVLGKGLVYFAQCIAQYSEFAKAMARGDLSATVPPAENEMTAPLKTLHANLRHLTWQSQQVAAGDYKQRVDFMGDFSNAFNTMIRQMAERQQKLEAEVTQSRKKTDALEQSNSLLTYITQNIPQQIIVIERHTRKILFMNGALRNMAKKNASYVKDVMDAIFDHNELDDKNGFEVKYTCEGSDIYLFVSSYFIEWHKSNAIAFMINDISVEKSQMKELEAYAFYDPMTHLHNRFSGMLTLNRWMDEKKHFSLVFVDLDNLKYINDKYGHIEGDRYITCAAGLLDRLSPDRSVICRIGGDEFMLLIPDAGYDEAHAVMSDIHHRLMTDEYLKDKDFSHSLSFGIVVVDSGNELTASDILSMADEKMYANKRERKKVRQ
jgi:diguanylate cyclase (GGDEF)-like protein